MGRIENDKYLIKMLINYRVGSYYSIILLYIFAPFIYTFLNSLNPGVESLQIVPDLLTWIFSEISITVILVLRILRDYLFKKKIFLTSNSSRKQIDVSNRKLESIFRTLGNNRGDLVIKDFINILLTYNESII